MSREARPKASELRIPFAQSTKRDRIPRKEQKNKEHPCGAPAGILHRGKLAVGRRHIDVGAIFSREARGRCRNYESLSCKARNEIEFLARSKK